MIEVFTKKNNTYSILVTDVTNTHVNTELNEVLDENERLIFENMASAQRKKEFLYSRIVLQKLMPKTYSTIQYQPSGKPYMKHAHISISHSKNLIAAITSQHVNVAIDVEYYREKIQDIASKFLNKEEEKNFTGIETLTLVWCAKETLYKLCNASVNFKDDYTIKIISNIQLEGRIITSNFEKTIELLYFRNSKFCLVWGFEKNT